MGGLDGKRKLSSQNLVTLIVESVLWTKSGSNSLFGMLLLHNKIMFIHFLKPVCSIFLKLIHFHIFLCAIHTSNQFMTSSKRHYLRVFYKGQNHPDSLTLLSARCSQ